MIQPEVASRVPEGHVLLKNRFERQINDLGLFTVHIFHFLFGHYNLK